MRIEDVGKGMKPKLHEKEPKEKKPRRPAVKNASFFLYQKQENGELSPLDSYQTEAEIRIAYEKALDDGIPENQLAGFKGRFLEFEVKETKRRITVK